MCQPCGWFKVDFHQIKLALYFFFFFAVPAKTCFIWQPIWCVLFKRFRTWKKKKDSTCLFLFFMAVALIFISFYPNRCKHLDRSLVLCSNRLRHNSQHSLAIHHVHERSHQSAKWTDINEWLTRSLTHYTMWISNTQKWLTHTHTLNTPGQGYVQFVPITLTNINELAKERSHIYID